MNSSEQKEFLQATAWLRPFTRLAAAFSIKTQGVLPASIRNVPLKLISRIIGLHHKGGKSACSNTSH